MAINHTITTNRRYQWHPGRESRQDGGVAEKSNSPISGPAEDAPSKYTQVPIELLAKQLPIQTLGHIQHHYEALSELHTLAHHRGWCIIHAELGRLVSSKWRFICINGGKTLKTIWNELEAEFPAIFNNCWLSVMSGLASNPANREIASSSGRLSTKTFFFFDFFPIFF